VWSDETLLALTEETSMDTRTVLILGANGRIGASAVTAFADAGWNVLAQVRRPPRAPRPDVRFVEADPADVAAIRAAVSGASVVVNALNPSSYAGWDRDALPLANAATAIAEALGARLMLPGNVYAWGTTIPARVTPTTPRRPDTPHGRIRETLEGHLEDRAMDGRLRATVVTAGDFFGPTTGTWIDLLIAKRIARGQLSYPGARDIPHAWAYLPDLARTFVALAERPSAAALERVTFPGHTLTGDELLDGLEAAARKIGLAGEAPLVRRTMSWLPVRALGLVVPDLRALARMSYLWRVPHSLDGAALTKRIGAIPQTPLVDALATSLAALPTLHGRATTAGSSLSTQEARP
jgi:nucleoside-diphosphate-sugar epimerase